jgi:putrescine transport system ATP-binding protein
MSLGLAVSELSAGYGPTVVLDGVSFEVRGGGTLAVLGRNGVGKSTLLATLMGLTTQHHGTIRLGEQAIETLPTHVRNRMGLGYVPQEREIFPSLTAEENLAVSWREGGWSIEAVFDLFPALKERRRNTGNRLSGGEQQMLAIGRALVGAPKVLLLDEPLAALDKKLRAETQFELVELQRRLGTTFLIVTHDQEEAMTVAGRMAVMDRGRIAQVGTPAEIYEQPNSRYVAEFVGDVNLIEAKVAGHSGDAMELASDLGVAIRVRTSVEAKAGDTIWLALRPEKLALGLERPTDTGANAVEGRVHEIGYLGDLSIYHVRLANGALFKASRPNVTRLPIGWGDAVWLSWAPDAGVVLTR